MVSLADVAYQFMIISGSILLVIGCIGNVLNLFVFTSWIRRSYKSGAPAGSSNGPIYLFTASVCNLIVISYPLATRIFIDGYRYPVTISNVFLVCKFRFFALQTAHLISLVCICLATLDRFFLSSRNVRLRQMSFTTRQTKQCIVLVSLIVSLQSIPIAIYYNVLNSKCAFISQIYSLYYLFMVIILFYGVIPAVCLAVFGSLTLSQLRAAAGLNNRRERQLSRMHLIQSLSVVISSAPYCVYNIYASSLFANTLNATKTPVELFCQYLVIVMFYIHSATNFYIFFFSTPNFRKQVKKVLMCDRQTSNKNQAHALELNTIYRITMQPKIA